MVERMVPHGMSIGHDPVKNIPMLTHIIPNTKKAGFNFEIHKDIQHHGGRFGHRPVVKGKIGHLIPDRDLAQQVLRA